MTTRTAANVMTLPEVKNFARALERDKAVATGAEKLIQEWAESQWGDHSGRGDLRAVDFDSINREAYGTMLLTDYTRRLDPATENALDVALAALQAADPRIRNEDDAYSALDPVVQAYIDRKFDLRTIEDIAEEVWREAKDSSDLAKDPYGYHGVSRRDFMANTSLHARTARLAETLPKDSSLRRRLATVLTEHSR